MGVPLGTMKSWIRRGLAKLKPVWRRANDRDELLAAEFVLGLLEGEDLLAARARNR